MPGEIFLWHWNEGSAVDAYRELGAHIVPEGVRFAVWAPHAQSVRVTGDFCGWDAGTPLAERDGFWEGTLPGIGQGAAYKYIVRGADGTERWKADPFARFSELRPNTASVVWEPRHIWRDEAWMQERRAMSAPMNIYELHAGSWRVHPDGSLYTWTELADELVPYVKDMGYTHIELLPVMEHPLDASWGYQLTGFFAATARHGKPEELMELIDRCHEAGIGVILDWVPGHFCRDAHGLGCFDGTELYSCGDHPDWGTYKFNFASRPVRSFLSSSALFWLREFHADGLRVDGVSSMLYLNFGISDGKEKRYNKDGGEDDPDAVEFLRELSKTIGREAPGAFTAAEESSAWPLVTCPPEKGGLGFHYKWDMGWMNDTLRYFSVDFPGREYNHNLLTFSLMYAFSENFILPLSHDEVVHGKKSLIGRMPGDWWRQFAGMRLLLLYTLTHPGAKLLFMGQEFGQFIEWREYEGLEWFLLDYPTHAGLQRFTREANRLYLREKALWQQDHGWNGFQWLDADNAAQGVLAYRRTAADGESILCVFHMQPHELGPWRLGVPEAGGYEELLSSDDPRFGGSGKLNPGLLPSEAVPCHGQPYSIVIKVPPVGGILIKLKKKAGKQNT